MKLRLFVLPALLLLLPGCIVVRDRHRGADRRECRPNEYWDGYECRHKGRGNGNGHHRH